jgi:succinate dehydrogenase/fumarate reductase flavoprotein subunit
MQRTMQKTRGVPHRRIAGRGLHQDLAIWRLLADIKVTDRSLIWNSDLVERWS